MSCPANKVGANQHKDDQVACVKPFIPRKYSDKVRGGGGPAFFFLSLFVFICLLSDRVSYSFFSFSFIIISPSNPLLGEYNRWVSIHVVCH